MRRWIPLHAPHPDNEPCECQPPVKLDLPRRRGPRSAYMGVTRGTSTTLHRDAERVQDSDGRTWTVDWIDHEDDVVYALQVTDDAGTREVGRVYGRVAAQRWLDGRQRAEAQDAARGRSRGERVRVVPLHRVIFNGP